MTIKQYQKNEKKLADKEYYNIKYCKKLKIAQKIN